MFNTDILHIVHHGRPICEDIFLYLHTYTCLPDTGHYFFQVTRWRCNYHWISTAGSRFGCQSLYAAQWTQEVEPKYVWYWANIVDGGSGSAWRGRRAVGCSICALTNWLKKNCTICDLKKYILQVTNVFIMITLWWASCYGAFNIIVDENQYYYVSEKMKNSFWSFFLAIPQLTLNLICE